MAPAAGLFGNRFAIDRLAGSGAMGAVYRARDLQTGAVVALKVLHPHAAAHGERFEREACMLRELDHPGIVRLVGYGVAADGQAFIAMEWLEGEDLAQRIGRQALTVDEALRLGEVVAEALGVAHGRGVVHRDLKPSNIFLVGGAIGRPKVVDFGIARVVGATTDRLTKTGVLLGTPAYMAPEQVRAAKAVGPPADVYALGGVLFSALTGRLVFPADTPMAMAVSALMDAPPSVATLRSDVPPELDALLAQLLAKRPADRPADGQAAARLLRDVRVGRQGTMVPSEASAPSAGRCLIFARPPAEPDAAAPPVAAVTALVQQHHGQLCVLADGTAIVTIDPQGTLAEQVSHGARCALALRELAPALALTLVAEESQAGSSRPATRTGVALLAQAHAREIALDATAARLLPPPFDVRHTPQGPLLCGLAAPSAAVSSGADGLVVAAGGPSGADAFGPTAAVVSAGASSGADAFGPTAAIVSSTPAAANAVAPAVRGPSGAPPVAHPFAPTAAGTGEAAPGARFVAGPTPAAAIHPTSFGPSAPAPARGGISARIAFVVGGLVFVVAALVAGGWWWTQQGEEPRKGRRGSAVRDQDDGTTQPRRRKRGPRRKGKTIMKPGVWKPGKGSPFADNPKCPEAHCALYQVPDPEQFDPVDGIADALRFAHQTDPNAKFASIYAAEIVGPTVDLTRGEMVYYTLLTQPGKSLEGLTVWVAHGSLMLRALQGGLVNPRPVKPPKCRLEQAWAVAEHHGLSKYPKATAHYFRQPSHITLGGQGVVWRFDVYEPEYRAWYVAATHCAWLGGTHPKYTVSPHPPDPT